MLTDVLKTKIDNHNPVELFSLVDMMSGVAYLYKNLIQSNPSYNKLESRLLVDKVTKGSIILDLIATMQSLGGELSPLFEYTKWLKRVIEFFLTKHTDDPQLSLPEANSLKKLINITANDIGGNLNISIANLITINTSSAEAKELKHNLDMYITSNFQDSQVTIYQQVPMYWDVSNFGNTKQDGKVIIDNIDPKSKYVIFVNHIDKMKCTSHNENYPTLQWQQLIYHVDVEAVYIANKLREYKILKVYDNVIPFEDE